MDFDIHEDARTEGVALGAAPFLMCGWKARREEVRVTVPERAKPQTWRLVRMGDEREGARIGASPYDPVPRRGDLVKKVCGNVVYSGRFLPVSCILVTRTVRSLSTQML